MRMAMRKILEGKTINVESYLFSYKNIFLRKTFEQSNMKKLKNNFLHVTLLVLAFDNWPSDGILCLYFFSENRNVVEMKLSISYTKFMLRQKSLVLLSCLTSNTKSSAAPAIMLMLHVWSKGKIEKDFPRSNNDNAWRRRWSLQSFLNCLEMQNKD